MVQDTINAVKEAEERAEKIVSAAAEESRALVENAKEEAEVLKAAKEEEARQTAKEAMEKAVIQGEEILADFRKASELDIGALKELAALKGSKAVELIISRLIK